MHLNGAVSGVHGCGWLVAHATSSCLCQSAGCPHLAHCGSGGMAAAYTRRSQSHAAARSASGAAGSLPGCRAWPGEAARRIHQRSASRSLATRYSTSATRKRITSHGGGGSRTARATPRAPPATPARPSQAQATARRSCRPSAPSGLPEHHECHEPHHHHCQPLRPGHERQRSSVMVITAILLATAANQSQTHAGQ